VCTLQKCEHQEAGADRTGGSERCIEGLLPFESFGGIGIHQLIEKVIGVALEIAHGAYSRAKGGERQNTPA
jgi:hypothetical protein